MKSTPDQPKMTFGALDNSGEFTLPGDETGYVYRKDGAAIQEARFLSGALGKFKPTTMVLNPLTEVIPWHLPA